MSRHVRRRRAADPACVEAAAYETVLLEADAGEGAWHSRGLCVLYLKVSGMGALLLLLRADRGRVEAPVHRSGVAAGSRSLVAAVGGVVQLAPDLHREREEGTHSPRHDVPVVEDVAGDAVVLDEFLRPVWKSPRHRAGVASMAWRTIQHERAVTSDFHTDEKNICGGRSRRSNSSATTTACPRAMPFRALERSESVFRSASWARPR